MRIAAPALALALFAAPAAAAPVDARDHDHFWLWAGVEPQPVLRQAHSLYILAGEVTARGGPVRLIGQRAAAPRIRGPEIWLAVRVETLRWPRPVYDQLLATLARWRAAGGRIVGVQIDFDARTRHLADYAAFLAYLRARLPADCRLGITGLLDWSANGDPAGLAALAGVVDEAALQIYQGRRVIPGYERYLATLDRLPLPFRIGILQGGDWTPPPGLTSNRNYRGTIVFLVNPAPPRP
ncbi:MAG TPA: DUF3142 domain-containing protein [Allosphingosinicella sp.]|uniref:DUF3142 domain-containing protein n=1 Tax=Allosphingosinicella sp. TaxID=2823234 RepID=UPI002F290B8D